MSRRYLEDLKPGEVQTFGSATLTVEAIKAFAAKFDPQPFHLDETAAKASLFQGLAASGWHTAALTMQMLVCDMPGKLALLASPGFDELRWLKPVRPGDQLHVRCTCLDVSPSRSHPERGHARFKIETFNQADECVMHYISLTLIARRPTASG